MSIQKASNETIEKAGELLRSGRLVAFPTETVYGLGANALNDDAVLQIYHAKARPQRNPLIVHVASVDNIEQVANLQALTREQSNWFDSLLPICPGPLTIVLPRNPSISSLATAGKDTIGVRIPKHKIAQRVLRAAGIPIAAPSANRSNYVSPTRAQHVYDCMGEEIDLIVDGGLCIIGIESTIISLVGNEPVILRNGAYSKEELEDRLKREVQDGTGVAQDQNESLTSPGQLASHYCPHTPLRFRHSIEVQNLPKKFGAVVLSAKHRPLEYLANASHISYLSNSGDLYAASQNLYDTLRELDKEELDMIVIDSCDDSPLGRALMDRITRATCN